MAVFALGIANFFGDLLGFLVFYILRFRRKLVLEHLTIAFPEKTLNERKQIALECYRNQGRTLFELLLVPLMTPANAHGFFSYEGMEHLQKTLSQKKGVLILSAHMGNGDFGSIALVLARLPIASISKHFKSEWLNRFWFGLRESKGLIYISEEKSSFQILKCLKQGMGVIFVLDQFMGPPVGVATRFFGKETGTAAGLAVFALRSGLPVVPAYTYRGIDGKHRIVVEQALNFPSDISVDKLTQIFTDRIESWVRLHPGQWMWLHRRWKTFEVR